MAKKETDVKGKDLLSIKPIGDNQKTVFETWDKGNNQFVAAFDAIEVSETLIVRVHNLQGQTVIQNRVQNVNGRYEYNFDLSYAPAGIYLLRFGNESFGKIKRFVVQ